MKETVFSSIALTKYNHFPSQKLAEISSPYEGIAASSLKKAQEVRSDIMGEGELMVRALAGDGQ